jgi:hypothetical protein
MSTSQASACAGMEETSVSIDFSCHICGGSDTDLLCTSSEVEEQIEVLRHFHRRRLRHPTESALKDRVNFTQDYRTDIAACRGCGLVCRAPRPSAATITGAYSEDRYGDEHLCAEFELQRRWANSKVESLEPYLREGSGGPPLIVEVGSFVGGFLAAGRERGWRMMGIDPGKEVTAFCRKRGLDVWRGTLIEAPIAAGAVDAVAIWNTFDQLPNPDSTLAAARHMLRRRGILVIRIPNGASFRRLLAWRKQATEPMKGWLTAALAWNNLLGFPYVYGYTLRTTDQLLARHGFARIGARADTLMTLSNEESTIWAQWEEALLKRAYLTAACAVQAWHKDNDHFAPWLDIYYQAVDRVPDTTLAVARTSPAPGISH